MQTTHGGKKKTNIDAIILGIRSVKVVSRERKSFGMARYLLIAFLVRESGDHASWGFESGSAAAAARRNASSASPGTSAAAEGSGSTCSAESSAVFPGRGAGFSNPTSNGAGTACCRGAVGGTTIPLTTSSSASLLPWSCITLSSATSRPTASITAARRGKTVRKTIRKSVMYQRMSCSPSAVLALWGLTKSGPKLHKKRGLCWRPLVAVEDLHDRRKCSNTLARLPFSRPWGRRSRQA